MVRGDVQNYGGEGVPPEAVPKHARELRLAVRYVRRSPNQRFHHAPERQETLKLPSMTPEKSMVREDGMIRTHNRCGGGRGGEGGGKKPVACWQIIYIWRGFCCVLRHLSTPWTTSREGRLRTTGDPLAGRKVGTREWTDVDRDTRHTPPTFDQCYCAGIPSIRYTFSRSEAPQ